MTLPLFPIDDVQERESRLREVFSAWVEYRARSGSTVRSERPLREESAKVYQEMWFAFSAYCAARGLDLEDIEISDIRAFLAIRGTGAMTEAPRVSTKGQDLSLRYAWRMINLIDRVIRFDAQRAGIRPNPAASDLLKEPEYRYANANVHTELPDYFDSVQAKRLIEYVTRIHSTDAISAPVSWKDVRDRTAIATMLGGGLAPGDVRALRMHGVTIAGGRKAKIPWKLSLPGNGNSPARETPLAEWAGRQLAFWLSVRENNNVEGELVFPSTRTGKPWSHTACYNACKAVLENAGIQDAGGGVFKLRHTFALRQLSKGRSEEEVAKWLGLIDLNGMTRYRRIVARHVDLV